MDQWGQDQLRERVRERFGSLPAADADAATALLGEQLSRCAQALEGVRLDPLLLSRQLLACARSPEQLGGLRCEDLALAGAALQADPRAVQLLGERLRSEAARALARIDRSPALLDEVVQTLQVELLLPRGDQPGTLSGYRGEGPLGAWLRASAARLGLRLRARPAEPEATEESTALSPELELIRQRYRPQFERCFAEELAALPQRSRSLLRLHYVDGLGIDQLGAIYHVGRSTAARWLIREREGLIAGVRRRLTEELGIAPAELQSLVRLVASQLHVSIARLLAG